MISLGRVPVTRRIAIAISIFICCTCSDILAVSASSSAFVLSFFPLELEKGYDARRPAFDSSIKRSRSRSAVNRMVLYRNIFRNNGDIENHSETPAVGAHNPSFFHHRNIVLGRRGAIIAQAASILLVLSVPTMASLAETGRVKTSQYPGPKLSSGKVLPPKLAFQTILKSRDELKTARKILREKKDTVNTLRNFIADGGFNNLDMFEISSKSILTSGMLSDEDKKAIGTIRTYGVGADVIIMYGGFLSAIDEENEDVDLSLVEKNLARTYESLNEVITICENNGF